MLIKVLEISMKSNYGINAIQTIVNPVIVTACNVGFLVDGMILMICRFSLNEQVNTNHRSNFCPPDFFAKS